MPIDISKIQAICFDVDGTLRDTDDQYVARVESFMRPFRWLFPKRESAAFSRWLVMRFEGPVNGVFSLADKLGLDGPLHRLIEIVNPWKGRDNEAGYLIVPGVSETLEVLSRHFPLAVITARGEKSTRNFMETTGLSKYFDHVASALTSPRGKPQPDPILWAAKEMKVAPENCIMVGDTYVDIIAGRAAGAQTIAVLSGFGEEQELREVGADLIIESVAKLPELLGFTN